MGEWIVLFTVCVLLYGDYPALAERVLSPLCQLRWLHTFYLRIGLNDVSDATRMRVADTVLPRVENGGPVQLYQGRPPYTKYPMMRRLFHEPALASKYVMWFDDDSWVSPDAPDNWFSLVEAALAKAAVVGAPYVIKLRGGQAEFIKKQPWYTGIPIPRKISFITGGWWATTSDFIKRYDWPITELNHNGGDVMLGALLHQQRLKIGKFTQNLGINADDSGICSTAPRRGYSELPIGVKYD